MEQARRTLLVIDGQNLSGAVQSLRLEKISYPTLREKLARLGKASIEMSRVYIGVHKKQQRNAAAAEAPISQQQVATEEPAVETTPPATWTELVTEAIQEYTRSEPIATVASVSRRTTTGKDKSEGFFRVLRFHGFVVQSVEIINRADGTRKGDVDGLLIAETMEIAIPQIFDQLILVAGDGDYEHLMHALKRRGIRTVVAYVQPRTSRNLLSACDKFMDITDTLRECAEAQAGNDRERNREIK